MPLEWVFIAGGTCLYGDQRRPCIVESLWWTRTPITYGDAQGHVKGAATPGEPVTGLNMHETIALAEKLGGRLPSSLEWEWAATGPEARRHPWGNEPWHEGLANIRPTGLGRPSRVGAFARGATPDGLFDMAGNVWEWTSSRVPLGGFVIRGGSYNSTALHTLSKFLNAAPSELRSSGIGVRLVKAA